jgi:DNA-binding NtrC family response regulator
VRDLYPDTLRIVLSASTEPRRVLDAVNRGALYGFYPKPWDDDTLRNNVGAACRHHRRLQDRLQDSAPAMPESENVHTLEVAALGRVAG